MHDQAGALQTLLQRKIVPLPGITVTMKILIQYLDAQMNFDMFVNDEHRHLIFPLEVYKIL